MSQIDGLISPEELENAYVFNNIHSVDSYVFNTNNDIAGQIDALDNLVVALDSLAEQRFAEAKQRLSSEYIHDEDASAVKDMVLDRKITVQVDDEFIAELFKIHTSGKDALGTMNIDQDDLEQVKNSAISVALQELAERRQIEAHERDLQTVEVVRLNTGKEFTIRVPADATKIEVQVQMDVDPRTEPVDIGPNAVIAIIGGKLTDEDYDAIAEQAQCLPGIAGEVCREQLAAAAEFAESTEAHGRATDEASHRISYSEQALSTLLYKDSKGYNPAIGIFRIALDRSAMRHVGSHRTQDPPQPFTS